MTFSHLHEILENVGIAVCGVNNPQANKIAKTRKLTTFGVQ